MALSFAESARRLQDYQSVKLKTISTYSLFQESDKYEKYTQYSDAKISTIDESGNIKVDSSQMNFTQEINSQFIPFEMSRFIDGIDLMNMTLVIHFVNPEGLSDHAKPVNVSFSEDKIQFAWLVDEKVTAIAGEIKFEIIAFGLNEKQKKYLWKSQPNGKLNIQASLSGNGVIPEGTPGYMDLLEQIEKNANDAEANANTAVNSAQRAENAAQNVETAIDGVKQEITQDVTQKVNINVDSRLDERLGDYYTKPEIDNITDNIMPDNIYGGTSEWSQLMALNNSST